MQISPFSLEEIKNIPEFELRVPNFLKSTDGINLAYYEFMPESHPRAIIIFYHGGGLYINKTYQWVGLQLQEHYNIGSYFIDIRGHGKSGGPRGDAATIDQVLEDINTVIEFVRIKHPNVPLYLVGHSSGSGLLLNYSKYQNKREDYRGYIFLAPFLGPQSGTLRYKNRSDKSFIKKVRVLVYILNNIFNINILKHIPTIYFNYSRDLLKQDPLILSYYTYAMSCATSPYHIKEIFENIDKPFGIYIGQLDEQFIPEKVIAYKNVAHKVANRSHAQIVPEAKHISILCQAAELISQAINTLEKLR